MTVASAMGMLSAEAIVILVARVLASVAPPAWARREGGVTSLGKRPARVLARHRFTSRPACSPVCEDPAGRGSGGESSHS